MRQRSSNLFDEIDKGVANGRAIVLGPGELVRSGETLIRAISRAKDSAGGGAEPAIVFVNEASGCGPALPQILRNCGVSCLIVGESQFDSTFPYRHFLWEGLDGTRIFIHRTSAALTASNANSVFNLPETAAKELAEAVQQARSESEQLPSWVGELPVRERSESEDRTVREKEMDSHDHDLFSVCAPENAPESARAQLLTSIDTSAARRPFVVLNTTGFERNEVTSLPDGTPIYVEVPRCGYAVVDADDQPPVASFAAPVEVSKRQRLVALDNGMLRIIFDGEGLIRGIRDHRMRREVLAPGQRGNVLQFDNDGACKLETLEVVESAPLRATVRMVRVCGRSRVEQRISLSAASARIVFHTAVDWQDEHQSLQITFTANVRSLRATYETPYGHVERPTQANTAPLARADVSAQSWVDLSEPDFGVALLNDRCLQSGVRRDVITLKVSRSSENGGRQTFGYALLPHVGDLRRGFVLTHAHSLISPLQLTAVEPHSGPRPPSQSFFQTDRLGVIIETVKWADKEHAIIVRCYEAYGTRGVVRLSTTLPVKTAFTADLLERTLDPLPLDDGEVTFPVTPFAIVTLKFQLE